MMSLRRSFVLFLFVVSFVSGFFFVGIYWGAERAFYIPIDNHLVEDVAEFERLYTEGEDINKLEPFVLRNQKGLVVDASRLDLIPPFNPNTLPYIDNSKFGTQTYRFITVKTSKGFYLQYGIDISQGMEFLKTLRYVLFTGWMIFISLILIFYWLFVHSSLLRLERAVRDSLEGKEVSVYAEIKPLVEELKKKMQDIKNQSIHYRDLLMALSHSLKTPLGRLYLKIDLLSRRHKDLDLRGIREELHQIERSARTFLRLTKLEAQSYSPSFQTCNIKSLLEELFSLYPLERLRSELEEVLLECDPELAMEVFDVLLDNAIRHGEGEVWVFLKDGKLRVENLSSKPLVDGVFEKPVGGVGLYVAKRLCDVLGWKIGAKQEVEGELYKVSFWVEFPKGG